jgi:ADP-heptose:LPS heptosyltransferase
VIGRPGTVLVLRALGLGDLCAGVPALRAIRRAFPGADLVLAAPAWQAPLAELAGVDRVVATAPLQPLAPQLHGADLAVNLHGRGPQSTQLLVGTSPGRLIAFHHPDVDAPLVADVEWRADEHEVDRWCRLLAESGIEADPTALQLDRPETPAEGGGPAGRRSASGVLTAVVHPGAAAPGRRWPAERFGAVVAALVASGHRVFLTGSADERALCNDVVGAAGASDDVEVLAGGTTVLELAAVVADADLVVANDTGVAHLATAFGTPSVVLFGPTPPSEWGPPPGGVHRALWRGRRGDPHARELDAGLAAIEVDDVLRAVEEVTGRVAV